MLPERASRHSGHVYGAAPALPTARRTRKTESTALVASYPLNRTSEEHGGRLQRQQRLGCVAEGYNEKRAREAASVRHPPWLSGKCAVC